MKVFVVFGLVLVVCCTGVLSDETMDNLKKISVDCRKENGVTEEEFMNLKTGKMKQEDAKENLKCSIKCFLTKASFMNDAGQLNAEALKTAFGNKPDMNAAIDKCKTLDSSDVCDKAFKIAHCVFDHKLEI